MKDLFYKRGDLVLIDLDPIKGSEQGRTRPCIIVQNDIANKYSPVTNIIPITDKKNIKKIYPFLVELPTAEAGISKPSVAQCNQIRTIDTENRIIRKLGRISEEKMQEIGQSIRIHLSLI